MSYAASELPRVLAVARSQRPDPAGWSLAVNLDWLQHSYFSSGVSRLLDALPSGELGGCASVRADTDGDAVTLIVTSMLRPGHEHLWPAQLAWIEAQAEEAGAAKVRIVSECLSDAEVIRCASAGYDLVFEELAMERGLGDANAAPAAPWPPAPASSTGETGLPRRASPSMKQPSGIGRASRAGRAPSGSTRSPATRTSFLPPRSACSAMASPPGSWSVGRAGSTSLASLRLTAASGSRARWSPKRHLGCEH
jgi:hypothetical protein